MKNKYIFLMCLVFMVVGYASVSTTLSLSNNTDIANILSEFDVYFSDVKINGEQNLVPVKDTVTLEFQPDFSEGDFELEYDVTNGSRNYDAEVDVVCTSDNNYIEFENNFDSKTILEASETKSGKLTVRDFYIGQEIVIGGEKFNVLSSTTDTVRLLAKENINANFRQEDGVEDLIFSSTYTWPYKPGPKEINVKTYSSGIYNRVNGYVNYLKGILGDSSLTGDLITLKELNSLGCTMNNDYSGKIGLDSGFNCNNSKYLSWLRNGNQWWTKSANSSYSYLIWIMLGDGIIYSSYNDISRGVRPVVTVSKSTLNNSNVTCRINATPLENKEMGNGNVPGAVEPLPKAEAFCLKNGYAFGMDYIQTYQGGDYDEYLMPSYRCTNDADYKTYDYYAIDGTLLYKFTGGIDPYIPEG